MLIGWFREITGARRDVRKAARAIEALVASNKGLSNVNSQLLELQRESIQVCKDAVRDRDITMAANIELSRAFERVAAARTLREARLIAQEILSGVGL